MSVPTGGVGAPRYQYGWDDPRQARQYQAAQSAQGIQNALNNQYLGSQFNPSRSDVYEQLRNTAKPSERRIVRNERLDINAVEVKVYEGNKVVECWMEDRSGLRIADFRTSAQIADEIKKAQVGKLGGDKEIRERIADAKARAEKAKLGMQAVQDMWSKKFNDDLADSIYEGAETKVKEKTMNDKEMLPDISLVRVLKWAVVLLLAMGLGKKVWSMFGDKITTQINKALDQP